MSARNAVIWFLRNDICKGVERLNNKKSIGGKKMFGSPNKHRLNVCRLSSVAESDFLVRREGTAMMDV